MTTETNPDLSNQEQRRKLYELYLKKTKPFLFWSYKFFLLLGVVSVGSIVLIVFKDLYSNLLGIAFLLFLISFVGMIITRYKLDGSLFKPWWEIY